MRRERQTKIIATLGPASDNPKIIERLFQAGVDVFRLNMSHGTHDDHRARIGVIRALEKKVDHPIGILLDLQGPKLRLGMFRGGRTEIVAGQPYRLDLSTEPGDHNRARLPHPEIFAVIKPGDHLMIDDGKVRLRVETVASDHATTTVVTGGVLSDRKGVNVPDATLPISALTEKDLVDLEFGLSLGVDWVALSFVQQPADVKQLRQLVGDHASIATKLEKPSALKQLAEIVQLSDAVMVARGDLGVELPPEDVPSIQRQIVRECRGQGKPVIVATQMLESMITTPTPTRAETSDVATAVYDGVDAVMLSAESASGGFPEESVAMMDRIIRRVERDPLQRQTMDAVRPTRNKSVAHAIGAAIRAVSEILPLAAIVSYTTSGASAHRVAMERSTAPILGLTPHLHTARRLTLVWGVHSVHGEDATDVEDMVAKAKAACEAHGYLKSDGPIVVVAGMPFGISGTTNMIRLLWRDAPDATDRRVHDALFARHPRAAEAT